MKLRLLGGVFPVLLWSVLPAAAGYLDVPTTGYPTIQAAVNHAKDTDTIRVAQGDYYENVVIDTSCDIEISGGWYDSFTRQHPDPTRTILHGGAMPAQSVVSVKTGKAGDIHLTLKGFLIRDGSGGTGGGISFFAQTGGSINARLQGNIITENGAGLGGGIHVLADKSTVLIDMDNNIIAGNTAPAGGAGGGFYFETRGNGSLQSKIRNCTVTDNKGSQFAGGLYADAQDSSNIQVDIRNSIFWGNRCPDANEMYLIKAAGANLTVNTSFSDIAPGGIDVKSGQYNNLGDNFNSDPLFADPAAADYHLTNTSPCIDTGSSTSFPQTDFEGHLRPEGPSPDVGADEFAPEAPVLMNYFATAAPGMDGTVFSYGGTLSASFIQVGDLDKTGQARGFLSFPISGMGDAPAVFFAGMRVHQSGVIGNPYADLGSVVVDHVDYGPGISPDDYNATALEWGTGMLSPASADLQWKYVYLNSSLQRDLDEGRSYSQYRLRFSPRETDEDGSTETVEFESSNDFFGQGQVPELFVRYFSSIPPLPEPVGQQAWAYDPVPYPIRSWVPERCMPFALRPVPGGGFRVEVGFPKFAVPLHIYLAVYWPAVSPDLKLILPDGSMQSVAKGIKHWRTASMGSIQETVSADVNPSSLPPGDYYLIAIVVPPGHPGLADHYMWYTMFKIP